ncbi:MAG: S8 family serine peptidase [Calditrichaeota bacterium]|nr:S8 family serine peptidase [Calditrichota bacterium]
MRTIITVLVLCLGTVIGSAAELSPLLPQFLSDTQQGEKISVLVFLENRLTMDEVYPEARALPMGPRREYVVNVLQERFAQMSPNVMEYLSAEQKSGNVSLLRPLWIVNAIRLTASATVIEALAKDFPEIRYITHDPVYDNTLDNGWGVIETQAPEVWAQFRARGEGVLVGHKDSGVNFDGCAKFDGRIWFNPGEDLNGNGSLDVEEQNGIDDDGNGYVDDFYGWNFDDNTNDVSSGEGSCHGTRTASVICSNVGVSASDTIAMAPGAKLLVMRGYLTQGSVFEGSQYAILMGVQVISASLSFKQSECDNSQIRECPNYVAHRWVSEMELAAGIVHSNSTGNDSTSNPRPLSCAAPSNCPPPSMTASHYQQGGVSSVVAVAGYNANGTFYTPSGVGPSGWSREDICVHPRSPWCGPEDSPSEYPDEFEDYPYHNGNHGLLKPDIAAPTSVQSISCVCNQGTIGGTSGATPHVGGALALIYSAFPGITPEEVYQVLVNGALDAGDAGADTTWGFGKLRMLPAIGNGMGAMGSVAGTVTVNPGGQALANVRLRVEGASDVYTDAQGEYSLFLRPGTYIGSYEKFGYGTVERQINIVAGQVDDGDLTMSITAGTTAIFNVRDPEGVVVPDIQVRHPLSGQSVFTDATGYTSFPVMHTGVQEFVIGENVEIYATQSITPTLTPALDTIYVDLDYSGLVGPTGPDAYGYYAYDDLDFGGPEFDWVELTEGLGQNLNLTGDNCVTFSLPFNLVFYGAAESVISVCANGHVAVGTTGSSDWSRWPIPVAGAPDNYIAVFYQDYRPENGGGVWYYYDAANGRAIIQWDDVPEYFDSGRATFQVHLYDPAVNGSDDGNSVIDILYSEYTGRLEASVGIENADGTVGLQYGYQLFYGPGAAPVRAGRSIRFTTDYITSADDSGAPLPEQFVLHQNYPNPFNSSTTFRFDVPQTSRVALRLYDITGREVATVMDELRAAGPQTIQFDATGLATGIYFARLEAEGHALDTRKILFLK